MIEHFCFSTALILLKNGKRICREGWNGKGMWLILVKQGLSTWHDGQPHGGTVDCGDAGLWALSDYIAMKTSDDKFVPWLASQTDILADDWMIA